ncbi:hypothetical protein WJX82_011499 [Trebouxia sp. C0006]
MELCDTSEKLQMFAECTAGGKPDVNAANFAINRSSSDPGLGINDSVSTQVSILNIDGFGRASAVRSHKSAYGQRWPDVDIAQQLISDTHRTGRQSVRHQDSSYLNSILAFNKVIVIQQCSAEDWAYDQAGGQPASFGYKNGPAAHQAESCLIGQYRSNLRP